MNPSLFGASSQKTFSSLRVLFGLLGVFFRLFNKVILAEFRTEVIGHVFKVIADLAFLAGEVHVAYRVDVTIGFIFGHNHTSAVLKFSQIVSPGARGVKPAAGLNNAGSSSCAFGPPKNCERFVMGIP
jgi:hypothetical protein